MSKFVFHTTCVQSDARSIIAMKEAARDITYATMARRCELKLVARELGYDRKWLVMRNDWHVSYHKSTYRGQPCYYFEWSAIEHIFIRPKGDRYYD